MVRSRANAASRTLAPTPSMMPSFETGALRPPQDEARMTDPRMYPQRPYLAVSAAIIRDGHVLVARRAKGASTGLFTLPGGVVEAGETLHQAVMREIAEETGIRSEPVALAGQDRKSTRLNSSHVALSR